MYVFQHGVHLGWNVENRTAAQYHVPLEIEWFEIRRNQFFSSRRCNSNMAAGLNGTFLRLVTCVLLCFSPSMNWWIGALGQPFRRQSFIYFFRRTTGAAKKLRPQNIPLLRVFFFLVFPSQFKNIVTLGIISLRIKVNIIEKTSFNNRFRTETWRWDQLIQIWLLLPTKGVLKKYTFPQKL